MARSTLRDPLRDSNFWLFDVAPIDAISLPIFFPLTGFASISSPEIEVEVQEIQEGNAPYPTMVAKGGSVGSITLTRGVTFYDSDFWRWVTSAINGNTGNILEVGGVTYRRSLLLVHFFRNTPFETTTGQAAALALSGGAFSVVTGAITSGSTGNRIAAGAVTAAQLAGLAVWNNIGESQQAIQIPARAFLLKDCIPTRYKTGSDFDASSGQVSITELDIHPHYVEEIALAA